MKIGSHNHTEVQVFDEPESYDSLFMSSVMPQARQYKPVPEVPIKYRGLPPFAKEEECSRTADFPHMKFNCEWFNPLQTQFRPEVEKDTNVVVSGRTSSGKTTIAEMVIAYSLGEMRKYQPYATAAYISPLKALATEKEQDWTSPQHWFSQYNISILTGDYILTEERKSELAQADIIAMSSEMLGSRIRRNEAEKNLWINNIRVLVVDESHLLTTGSRGPNLEVALLKFTKVNPNCRIVFLSATMPNVDDLGGWLTKLNGKPTSIIKSDYRPVALDWHWEEFEWSNSRGAYRYNEFAKIEKVLEILRQYPNDKFIVFVHAKKTGRSVVELLNGKGITVEFHNADAAKEKRAKIEASFRSRESDSLRVLVSTSTLAWGINMPARRVIIVGLHRGIEMVESLDIHQMGGRSGRVGIDIKGDVHVLIRRCIADPRITKNDIEFCKKIEPVQSKIANTDAVAFHMISEITERAVYDVSTACAWFSRTLSHHQHLFGETDDVQDLIKDVLRALLQCGAIKAGPDGKSVSATPIGKIASWFYFNPFDVASWAKNFRDITIGDTAPSIEDIAWALGYTATNKKTYATSNPDHELTYYLDNLRRPISGGADRSCFTLFCMLTNKIPRNGEYIGMMSGYRIDGDRICAAIGALHNMGDYFSEAKHVNVFYELPYRLKHGLDKGLELVMLPSIGKKTAEQIMSRRVFSCKDLVAAQNSLMPILSAAKWEKVKYAATQIALVGPIEYLKRQYGNNKGK